MTAYMKPKMSIDDQLMEQDIFARESGGSPRGELAVKTANPLLRQQQRQMAGREMDKKLQYGALGMQKKQVEFNKEIGMGRLGIERGRLGLAEKSFNFNLDQRRKANTLARWNVGLQLAFGVGNFMETMKQRRIQQRNWNTMLALLDQSKKQRSDLSE